MSSRASRLIVTTALAWLPLACTDDSEPSQVPRFCADFDVFADQLGGPLVQIGEDEEVCMCAATQPTEGQLTAKCQDDYFAGNAAYCDMVTSIQQSGTCRVGANPDAGTGGGDGAVLPDDTGDGCDLYAPDGSCCVEGQTDCCAEPPDLACPTYDFGTFPYTGPAKRMRYESSVAGSAITVTVAPGTANEASDTAALTGIAAYSFQDCGETYCPFFLGDYRFEGTETLFLPVTLGGQTKTKRITNLSVSLHYPAVGKLKASTGATTFKPHALVWLVEFDLSGPEFGTENGHKVATTRNLSAITASASLGAHTFELDQLEFELTDVTEVEVHAELTPSMSLTDQPPSATHSTSITCDRSLPRGTVELDSTATDPDSDLDFELWWLDGDLRHVGTGPWTRVLSNGSYTLEHRVFDLRGGYDNSVSTLTVSCP